MVTIPLEGIDRSEIGWICAVYELEAHELELTKLSWRRFQYSVSGGARISHKMESILQRVSDCGGR